MPRNDYVRPFGKAPQIVAPTGVDWRKLDQYFAEAIPIAGGFYCAPAMALAFGGAGISFGGSSSIEGGVATERDGRIRIATTFPVASPARNRFVRMPILRGWLGVTGGDPDGFVQPIAAPLGLQITTPGASVLNTFLPIPSRYLHDGATLAQMEFRFRVTRAPATTPTTPLAVVVFRISLAGLSATQLNAVPLEWQAATTYTAGDVVRAIDVGGIVQPLQFTALNTASSGGSQPAGFATAVIASVIADGAQSWRCSGYTGHLKVPASAAAYGNAGAAQLLGVTPLTNNVIDLASYAYGVLLVDQDPADVIVVHTAKMTYTSITTLGRD